jgi:hypothetical protein
VGQRVGLKKRMSVSGSSAHTVREERNFAREGWMHCKDLRLPLRPGLSDRTSNARVPEHNSAFPVAGYGLERCLPAQLV